MNGKTILITGAGAGIGQATAELFAKAGVNVVVADINEDNANKVANNINEQGYNAIAVRCDVSKEQDIKSVIDKTIKTYGSLDFAFNNAGISGPAKETTELDVTDFDQVININLRGVWLCMKYELEHMIKQGKGAIVNTASAGGIVALPKLGPYTVAKHGVVGLTKVAAAEYAGRGIRINAVCPGVIETAIIKFENNAIDFDQAAKMTPIQRKGDPSEVAQAVFWLCSDKASFMVGHSLSIDGGYTIL